MQAEVLMSSGETDTWGADNLCVFEDRGSLYVATPLQDDDPEDSPTVQRTSEVDNGPDLPPGTRVDLFRMRAQYAPGMWMKVVYP